MRTALVVLAVVIAAAVAGLALLIARTRILEAGRARRRLARIDDAVAQIDCDPDSAKVELRKLAENLELRCLLYSTLASDGKTEHFPREFLTQEALAESDLVFWLCHPNELQTAPDEIELMARITKALPGEPTPVQFFVFRFRVNTPHWAAERGWMAGITGPYAPGSDLQARAGGTFSELEPYAALTPADHVDHLLSKQGATLVTRTKV